VIVLSEKRITEDPGCFFLYWQKFPPLLPNNKWAIIPNAYSTNPGCVPGPVIGNWEIKYGTDKKGSSLWSQQSDVNTYVAYPPEKCLLAVTMYVWCGTSGFTKFFRIYHFSHPPRTGWISSFSLFVFKNEVS
jgi:hypothetical protein